MADSFLDIVKEEADKIQDKHDISASLIVSQAILESDWGKSELAVEANNLFGIKGEYNGELYIKETSEYVNEKWIRVPAVFRKYPSIRECIWDLAEKYVLGTEWERPHNRYAGVIGAYPYTEATKKVWEAGYATDPSYPEKLNRIIVENELWKLDKQKESVKEMPVFIPYETTVAGDDGHGLWDTPGKRTPYIESLGRSIRENEFNDPVMDFLEEELKRQKFKVIRTAPTDKDTPLSERVRVANDGKADVFVSIHYNALDGTFGGADPSGFSAHVQSDGYESAKIGRSCLKRLAQGTKQKNRGLVVQNLYVTRETKMPAVLFELGFMDNFEEAMLMLDKNFQKECAVEICQGLCDYYGIKYVPAEKVKTTEFHDISKSARIGDVTIKEYINYRSEPSLNSEVISELQPGHTCYLFETKGDWWRIGQGWISNPDNHYADVKLYDKKKEVEEVAEIKKGHEPSKWAEESWKNAMDKGLFDGTNPHDPLTREQAAIVIQRMEDRILNNLK